jgi:hypothetical protein
MLRLAFSVWTEFTVTTVKRGKYMREWHCKPANMCSNPTCNLSPACTNALSTCPLPLRACAHAAVPSVFDEPEQYQPHVRCHEKLQPPLAMRPLLGLRSASVPASLLIFSLYSRYQNVYSKEGVNTTTVQARHHLCERQLSVRLLVVRV